MFAGDDRPKGRARSALLAGSSCLELGYGRFMQTDPLGYDDGLNWYNYVGGDPINYKDPTGLTQYCADNTVSSNGTIEACASHGGPGDIVTDGGGGGGNGGGFGGFGGFSNGGGASPGVGGGGGGGGQPALAPTPMPQNPQPPVCTATQIRAQDIGEGVGAGGIAGAKVGGIVQKGGVGIALGSAALLQPEGVLIGGEIAGLGTTIRTTGYATAALGYGVALAGGADVRRELNDAAVRAIPFSGLLSNSLKDRIKAGLNRAEDSVGLGHTGCRR